MLTFEQVKTYFGNEASMHSKHILVEYVQCELLDSLFKHKESTRLSFIGGTAIRIAYGGNRFSEDLDFDNFGLTFEEFSSLLGRVVGDMRVKGFSVEFRLVERDAYHCYIKFPEMLKNAGLSALSEEKILIRIDTMQKEKVFLPTVNVLNKFDLYQDILVNPIDIILSQKLITVLERKREKGRDVYDISFLWGKTKPNFPWL
jgi:predicted nucleotidyltransferase component of viral defense system